MNKERKEVNICVSKNLNIGIDSNKMLFEKSFPSNREKNNNLFGENGWIVKYSKKKSGNEIFRNCKILDHGIHKI